MKKTVWIVLVLLILIGFSSSAKERSIIALPGHELGDQLFSINVGLFLPLFHQAITGEILNKTGLSPGFTGSFYWNAYLDSAIRIGVELSGAVSFDVNGKSVIFLPISLMGTYLINIDRFEIPLSLNIGANFMRYGEEFSNVALFMKPKVSCFYRYDANWSFGLNLAWWWNLEFPTINDDATMANYLEITPALFYHIGL